MQLLSATSAAARPGLLGRMRRRSLAPQHQRSLENLTQAGLREISLGRSLREVASASTLTDRVLG